MTRALFSIWDSGALGSSLAISGAGTNLTFTANSTDLHRAARALYPQNTGVSYAEFLVYAAAGSSPTISGNAAVGIATSSAGLNKTVGEDNNGYGWYPDGTIKKNNSTLQTITGYALNDILGVLLSCVDPSNPSLTFLVNGVVVGVQALASTGPWYLSGSIGGTTAETMFIMVNGGQQAFQYPQSGVLGWDFVPASINQVLLATDGYTSLPTDSVPNQVYPPDLSQDSPNSLTISRVLQFWPWRNGPASSGSGQSWGSIPINDPDGTYDTLIQNDVRDLPLSIYRTQQGASLDSAQTIATGVVDHVETSGDFQKTVYVKDGLALLDKNVQRSLELPNVDANAVGLPQPISIGACRNVSGLLISSDGKTYQFHDSSLLQIVEPRIAGKIISPLGTPPDYTVSADGKSLVLHDPPEGKFTASVSGLNSTIPPGATDVLSGAGEFSTFTLNSQFTANWDTFYNTFSWVGSPAPEFITSAGYGQIIFHENNEDGIPATIQTKTNVLQAGRSYVVKAYVDEMPVQDLRFANQPTLAHYFVSGYNYYLGILGSPLYFSRRPDPAGGINILAPMEVATTITNNQGVDLPLALTFLQNSMVSSLVNFKLKYVRMYELPDATSIASMTGCNLTTYMQQIMARLGVSSGQWDITDAQAIDTATGYNSGGYHLDQPTSGRNALQPMLDTWRSDIAVDRSGVIRTYRLVDPAGVSPVGTIDETVIVGTAASHSLVSGASQPSMINVTRDLAPGLTTSYDCRKNWTVYTDGDFGSTDLTDCPNQIRALLKKPFQQRASSAAQLSPSYLYAQQAPAFPSCFDLLSEAQAEADSTAGLYTVPRFFASVPVKSSAADAYDLGQVWTLKYPRYGLDAGVPVYIWGIVEDPLAEQVTLFVWY